MNAKQSAEIAQPKSRFSEKSFKIRGKECAMAVMPPAPSLGPRQSKARPGEHRHQRGKTCRLKLRWGENGMIHPRLPTLRLRKQMEEADPKSVGRQ